ncbi:hypothetical protein R1flu_018684 [Riccia fluitans]|uniref:PGG domain-containing protein n=1 Tax=Riccia fluitans TaxID=41844 RepID=A0ABD1ZIU6_9MARC
MPLVSNNGPPTDHDTLRERLSEAGKNNISTRTIIIDFSRSIMLPDENLDRELELKLLHLAAWTGDVDTVKELKGLGDAAARSKGGFIPLHLAASRGHLGVLTELICWIGKETHAQTLVSDEGFTPLHFAAYGGYSQCVKLLLGCPQIDVNAQDRELGRTALHFAAQAGHVMVVDSLTRVPGINLRCKDRIGLDSSMKQIPGVDDIVDADEKDLYRKFAVPIEGHTALHLAATQNNADLVSLLVRHPKISLNEGDTEYGMTPLHCAIRTGSMAAFSALMKVNGINVNATLVRGDKVASLQLAWERLLLGGGSLSVPGVWMGRPPSSEVEKRKRYESEEKLHVYEAIDLLKNHPSSACIMNELEGVGKTTQDSLNAFLVTATLLAGVTFSAYLQPPFGTGVGEYRSKPARLFWVFNGLAFFYAVFAILSSLIFSIRISGPNMNLYDAHPNYVALVRLRCIVPLIMSVGFGIGAFVAAGYANLPP